MTRIADYQRTSPIAYAVEREASKLHRECEPRDVDDCGLQAVHRREARAALGIKGERIEEWPIEIQHVADGGAVWCGRCSTPIKETVLGTIDDLKEEIRAHLCRCPALGWD